MKLWTIAIKSMRQRLLASSLTALSVALGVMLMVAVLVVSGIVNRTFSQSSVGYDLIIGPKGSPLQLVLSAIYRISPPIENLPYRYYQQLTKDKRITEAIPIALGDNTEQGGFPIVGTIPRYFELEYAPGRKFYVRGKAIGGPFDAIIGARVARENQWDIGSEFTLVHGGADSEHVHDEKFQVVGVLKQTGTPNDKSVFVNLEGFYQIEGHDKPIDEARRRWGEFFGTDALDEFDREIAPFARELERERAADPSDSHAHHHHHETPDVLKEVTSILVLTRSPEDAIMFSGRLKKGFQAQAVNPIIPMRQLMRLFVGNVRTMLMVLTALIIVVSGVGIFVSIYNSMADRRHEIAVMRALGARRQTVFSIILTESIVLCTAGGLCGLLLGHGLVFAAAPYIESQTGLLIDRFSFEPSELVLFPALAILASLVGFIPGLTAYRTDVADSL